MYISYLCVPCALQNGKNQVQGKYGQGQALAHSQGAFDPGICFIVGPSLLITAYAQYMDIFHVHC